MRSESRTQVLLSAAEVSHRTVLLPTGILLDLLHSHHPKELRGEHHTSHRLVPRFQKPVNLKHLLIRQHKLLTRHLGVYQQLWLSSDLHPWCAYLRIYSQTQKRPSWDPRHSFGKSPPWLQLRTGLLVHILLFLRPGLLWDIHPSSHPIWVTVSLAECPSPCSSPRAMYCLNLEICSNFPVSLQALTFCTQVCLSSTISTPLTLVSQEMHYF